eukprot:908792-Prorocentrum_lima.AAC.1
MARLEAIGGQCYLKGGQSCTCLLKGLRRRRQPSGPSTSSWPGCASALGGPMDGALEKHEGLGAKA